MDIVKNHKCQAVRSIESLNEDLCKLEFKVDSMRIEQLEDSRKLWIRIAVLTTVLSLTTSSEIWLWLM